MITNKKKILFTASVPIHFKAFHLPYLKWLQQQGFETHTAANGKMDLPFVDQQWNIDIQRSPSDFKNRKAFRQLKNIINRHDYALIHCHTPVAGVLTRLAAKSVRRNKGTKVLYTSHGFHFFKGAPPNYWAIFYPLECYLTRYADAVITINDEDFKKIKEKGADTTDYYKIPGMGVDGKKFFPISPKEKQKFRQEKGLPIHKTLFLYAAEFIPRKNHQFLLELLKKHPENFEDCLFIFAGKGALEEFLRQNVAQNQLADKVRFVGYQKEIATYYQLADIGISVSRQEGLGLNLAEAMMCGLPVIATDIRGHRDLIDNGQNGFLLPLVDEKSWCDTLYSLQHNKKEYLEMAQNALKFADTFSLKNSFKALTAIYKQYL